MDVKYTPQGLEGKTCNDCTNFKPANSEKGTCFRHEVVSTGSCNFFKKKE